MEIERLGSLESYVERGRKTLAGRGVNVCSLAKRVSVMTKSDSVNKASLEICQHLYTTIALDFSLVDIQTTYIPLVT